MTGDVPEAVKQVRPSVRGRLNLTLKQRDVHGKTDVDQEVTAAASDESGSGWWEDNGNLYYSLNKDERLQAGM
jgi:hypothetical protein